MSARDRVTIAAVEAEIDSEYCFTAAEGQAGAVGRPRADLMLIPAAMDTLTFCVLLLKNGHKVVGINHGAIDPTIHSAELGREDARQDARNKVRDYLGFRLRDQIAAEKGAAPAAKRYTSADILHISFLPSVAFSAFEVVARMRDGCRFSVEIASEVGARGETVQARGEALILAIANGEAP